MSCPHREEQRCNPTTKVYAEWTYIKNFFRCVYSDEIKTRKFFGYSTISAAFRNSNNGLRKKAANV
jgi:hypothetical protein